MRHILEDILIKFPPATDLFGIPQGKIQCFTGFLNQFGETPPEALAQMCVMAVIV